MPKNLHSLGRITNPAVEFHLKTLVLRECIDRRELPVDDVFLRDLVGILDGRTQARDDGLRGLTDARGQRMIESGDHDGLSALELPVGSLGRPVVLGVLRVDVNVHDALHVEHSTTACDRMQARSYHGTCEACDLRYA